jgi:hypothetical protein
VPHFDAEIRRRTPPSLKCMTAASDDNGPRHQTATQRVPGSKESRHQLQATPLTDRQESKKTSRGDPAKPSKSQRRYCPLEARERTRNLEAQVGREDPIGKYKSNLHCVSVVQRESLCRATQHCRTPSNYPSLPCDIGFRVASPQSRQFRALRRASALFLGVPRRPVDWAQARPSHRGNRGPQRVYLPSTATNPRVCPSAGSSSIRSPRIATLWYIVSLASSISPDQYFCDLQSPLVLIGRLARDFSRANQPTASKFPGRPLESWRSKSKYDAKAVVPLPLPVYHAP